MEDGGQMSELGQGIFGIDLRSLISDLCHLTSDIRHLELAHLELGHG